MINIASSKWRATDPELQGILLQLPSEASNGAVVLPQDPTLHDINHHYVDAFCKRINQRAPKLTRDEWDKGVTRSGMHDVVKAVCADALNKLSLPEQKTGQALLQQWHTALCDKLQALKKTDGCSGCYGRHANSKAIESHLRATLEDLRGPKVESFLRAAADADLAALKKWITDRMDVNAQDELGRTALSILLRNGPQQDETGKQVEACVYYLLSVPGIDVDKPVSLGQGEYGGNGLAFAIRYGRESVARYLIAHFPGIAFRGDEGDTKISCAARHCPELLKDLGMKFDRDGGKSLVAMYKDEMRIVGLKYRHGSHAFICKALNRICREDFAEGREAMKNLIIAATEMQDADMIAAAIREWHSQPTVLTGDVIGASGVRNAA